MTTHQTNSHHTPETNATDDVARRCPSCSGALIALGPSEIGIGADMRKRHVYWCSAGCRGPESDGSFAFFECPGCGSADTATLPRKDGVEEVECRNCGTITTLVITQTD
jgi:hypothetical protein